MIWERKELCLLVEAEALKQEIDPALCAAIVEVVSEWQPNRISVLSDDDLHLQPSAFPTKAGEMALMASRIGLFQFQGAQARHLDYKQGLDDLLLPTTNLEIGIKLLKRSLEQAGRAVDRALLIMYGYSIVPMIPKIAMKVKAFRELFLTRPDVH